MIEKIFFISSVHSVFRIKRSMENKNIESVLLFVIIDSYFYSFLVYKNASEIYCLQKNPFVCH